MQEMQCRRCNAGDTDLILLGWECALEKEVISHSSILAWKILWTEDPDGPQSMGLQTVGPDLAIKQQH